MWYTPLLHHARGLIHPNSHDVRAAALTTTTLHPEEHAIAPAALTLPGQLERVIACEGDTSLQQEQARLSAGTRKHAAALVFELCDVTLTRGALYTRGLRYPLQADANKLVGGKARRHYERAVLTSTLYGLRYFGHFLTDDCSMALVAEQLALPAVRLSNQHAHAASYERALRLEVETVDEAHFESLVVLSDFGQSSYKRARYERLRARFRQSVATTSRARGVYLRRGAHGAARVLENQAEVERRLAQAGFAIVDLEAEPLADVWRKLAGVPIVVGVEGSHLAHGLLGLRAHGGLVCIQPPMRFNNVFKDYTDCLGMSYGYVVANPSAGGFEVSCDELLRTIALVERRIAL